MSAPVDVLASASAFCDLVAASRATKFPGYWEGSAYRRHPCGVIQGAVKLTNEWTTSNGCEIAITDGDGWSSNFCRDSFANGNPHPKPLSGSEVIVWRSGRWASDEFRAALEPTLVELVERMQAHVSAAKAAADAARDSDLEASRMRRREIERAALARVQGGARP